MWLWKGSEKRHFKILLPEFHSSFSSLHSLICMMWMLSFKLYIHYTWLTNGHLNVYCCIQGTIFYIGDLWLLAASTHCWVISLLLCYSNHLLGPPMWTKQPSCEWLTYCDDRTISSNMSLKLQCAYLNCIPQSVTSTPNTSSWYVFINWLGMQTLLYYILMVSKTAYASEKHPP